MPCMRWLSEAAICIITAVTWSFVTKFRPTSTGPFKLDYHAYKILWSYWMKTSFRKIVNYICYTCNMVIKKEANLIRIFLPGSSSEALAIRPLQMLKNCCLWQKRFPTWRIEWFYRWKWFVSCRKPCRRRVDWGRWPNAASSLQRLGSRIAREFGCSRPGGLVVLKIIRLDNFKLIF